MNADKTLLAGNTAMLILKLLEKEDMYGYQMIETLKRQSKNVFDLKAGTLYPLLHNLEQKGLLETYTRDAGNARVRKYYRITKNGLRALAEKQKEWKAYVCGKPRDGGCELCGNMKGLTNMLAKHANRCAVKKRDRISRRN